MPGPRTPSGGTARQEELRRRNLGALLRLLHLQGGASRSELVARTGLNRSTVGALTSRLAAAGLVRPSAPVRRGAAGRPSLVVEPCSATYALAVEVGVEYLRAARVGLGGAVLARAEVPHTAQGGDADATAALVRDLLADLVAEGVCLGLGVAVCGLASTVDGTVPLAPNLGWHDVPLAGLLADALGPDLPAGLPVLVGNEADLGARAEHLRGAGVGTSDLVFLAGRVGVGGGIISGGQPFTGATGYAGEVGHVVVNPRGSRCRCGRTGCWETEIDEEAVLRATGRPPGTPVAQVLAGVDDPSVLAGLRHVGGWLGTGVANLVNLLSPQLVLFGGITGELFPLVEDQVREALAGALPGPRTQVRLALPSLGADSTLVGAAELVFAPLLDDPLGVMAVAVARSTGAARPVAATG